MILASVAAALLTPGIAFANPINLNCVLDDRGKQVSMEVSLNENEGSGSWQWSPDGRSVKRGATFTPSSVAFGPFRIDRRDLSIVRTNDALLVSQGDLPETTSGKCEIDKSQRAF